MDTKDKIKKDASGSDEGKDRSLIFLHIPKTGGTTLNGIIEAQYDPSSIYSLPSHGDIKRYMDDFKLLPVEQRIQLKLLKGHLLFRARLDQYMSQPCRYITLLREPIDRVISTYYYILETPSHYLHKEIVSEKVDLQVFSERDYPAVNNLQTYLLATVDPLLLGKHEESNYPMENLIESAFANIDKYFAVIGVLERFDEFLILLMRCLGWKITHYSKQNVNQMRPRREDVPERTIETIRNNNKYDMRLYNHARQRMDDLIALQGASFFEQVNSIK
jgi:hypothetical protein